MRKLALIILFVLLVSCNTPALTTSPLATPPASLPDEQVQNRPQGAIQMNYQEAAIGGVSLFLLILGIVEAAKQFGVTGNGSLILSIALGGALFGLFKASDTGLIPANVLPWVEVVVYGLGGGLAVSGLYDFVNNRLPKR